MTLAFPVPTLPRPRYLAADTKNSTEMRHMLGVFILKHKCLIEFDSKLKLTCQMPH